MFIRLPDSDQWYDTSRARSTFAVPASTAVVEDQFNHACNIFYVRKPGPGVTDPQALQPEPELEPDPSSEAANFLSTAMGFFAWSG